TVGDLGYHRQNLSSRIVPPRLGVSLIIRMHLANELGIAASSFDETNDTGLLPSRIAANQTIGNMQPLGSPTVAGAFHGMFLYDHPQEPTVPDRFHKFISSVGMIGQRQFRRHKP